MRAWVFGTDVIWKKNAAEAFVNPERFTITLADGSTDADTPLTWEHTGNSSDLPYPDCERCAGEGNLESPGGEWALYAVSST